MSSSHQSNMKQLKKFLRKDMREKISQLDLNLKTIKSQEISEKVLQHDKYVFAKRVGIYLSLGDEVQTQYILKDIFNSNKICFIPRYDSDKMDMLRIYSEDEVNTLPKTKWNIPQPSLSEEANRENALDNGGLDLMLIPGRAFTSSGYRLGRGKGYYDVYLKQYRSVYASKSLYTMGLAFNEQIVPELPLEEHDEPIDTVIYDA